MGRLLHDGPADQGPDEKPKPPKPEFPPVSKAVEGYTEVEPPTGDEPFPCGFGNGRKSGQMLAELPKDYASSKTRQFIAPTVSGGEEFARAAIRRLLRLLEAIRQTRSRWSAENLSIKGSDEESKSSVKRIFTDKVLLERCRSLPWIKGKGPIIDLDDLLVGNASKFLGVRISPASLT